MSGQDAVAAKLESWCQPGRPLDSRGPNASNNLFARDSRRRATLKEIREQYLARQSDVDHDKSCAVVTAGPPAAGKSTAVATLGPGYRIVDPDIIKDLLLRRALGDGTYDPLLEIDLPDGHPVHPRELAGLVHVESTMIANDVVTVALDRHENVVVEGTLGWWAHAKRLLESFDSHGYAKLSILSYDVPEDVAQQRALTRWWADRPSYADGLGGRFVAARVISDLYTKTIDKSDCADNARDLFDLAAGTIPEVYLRQQDLTGVIESRRT